MKLVGYTWFDGHAKEAYSLGTKIDNEDETNKHINWFYKLEKKKKKRIKMKFKS